MTCTRFEAIGAYLPSATVSTRELVERMDYEPPFDLQEITGIENRRVGDSRPGNYEDSFVLARRAADDCLARSRYVASDLDVVISASITRFRGTSQYFEPSFARMLANELGARSAIHCDVSNACAGMLTGVIVLDRMIKTGAVRNGLVVSGERITTISDTAVKEIDEPYHPQFGSLTVGDSAAAVIIDESTDLADRIDSIEMLTCAEYSHLCIGQPSDRNQGVAMYTDNAQMHKSERMAIWPTFYRDVAAKRGLTFADERYDYVIHHQVGTRFLAKMARTGEQVLGTPMPKQLTVVEQYGNTASTSHFVVMYEHLKSGRIGHGTKMLVVPAASGLVLGCLSATVSSLEV